MKRLSLPAACTAALLAGLALAGCGRDDDSATLPSDTAPPAGMSQGPADTAGGTISGDAAGSSGAISGTAPDAQTATTPGADNPGATIENAPTAAGPAASAAASAAR